MLFYVVVWFHKQTFHLTIYIKVAYKPIVMADNNDNKIYQIIFKSDEDIGTIPSNQCVGLCSKVVSILRDMVEWQTL